MGILILYSDPALFCPFCSSFCHKSLPLHMQLSHLNFIYFEAWSHLSYKERSGCFSKLWKAFIFSSSILTINILLATDASLLLFKSFHFASLTDSSWEMSSRNAFSASSTCLSDLLGTQLKFWLLKSLVLMIIQHSSPTRSLLKAHNWFFPIIKSLVSKKRNKLS